MIPTDEAIDAMALALQAYGAQLYLPGDSNPPSSTRVRRVLATALVAGAEHFPGPIADGIDGQWLSDRLDKLEALFVDSRDEIESRAVGGIRGLLTHFGVDIEGKTIAVAGKPVEAEERDIMRGHRAGYDLGWKEAMQAARDAAALARTDSVDVRVDAAYMRGQKMGMEVARAHGEGGPSDYEVWRDALLIAAQTVEVRGDTDEVVYVARKLVGTLRRTGARIDDDSVDDFAPDDVLSFTAPVEDDDEEDEIDCVRCGAPPGGHPDGCPTMTYPGHDVRETIGACRPNGPCPACQQRIAEQVDAVPEVTPDV
jgi:hypothetical protein